MTQTNILSLTDVGSHDAGNMPLAAEGEGRQARADPAIDLPPALCAHVDVSSATAADTPEIDALLDAAFGPGRHARTASLLRAGAEPIAGVSLVARDGGRLLGSIQYWPIELATDDAVTTLTLLGPVAVAADARTLGLGRRLLAASLAVADARGLDPILLIGDASYYGPFGFDAAATGDWQLPGPVDRHRLLLRQTGALVLPKTATVRAVNASALAAPAECATPQG